MRRLYALSSPLHPPPPSRFFFHNPFSYFFLFFSFSLSPSLSLFRAISLLSVSLSLSLSVFVRLRILPRAYIVPHCGLRVFITFILKSPPPRQCVSRATRVLVYCTYFYAAPWPRLEPDVRGPMSGGVPGVPTPARPRHSAISRTAARGSWRRPPKSMQCAPSGESVTIRLPSANGTENTPFPFRLYPQNAKTTR